MSESLLVARTPKINLLLNQINHKYPDVETLLQEPELEFSSLADAQDWLHTIRAICFEVAVEYVHNINSALSLIHSEKQVELEDALYFARDRIWRKSYKLAVSLESCIGDASMRQLDATAKLPIASELDKILIPLNKPFMYAEMECMKAGHNNSLEIFKYVMEWWNSNGADWNKKLKKLISKRKLIFQELEFSDSDLLSLRKHYNANILLADCLNSNCRISSRVKSEIKSTLLLPIAEIQKLQNA